MANAAHESRQQGEDGGMTIRKRRLVQTKIDSTRQNNALSGNE
jgi:hypothetical protein